ncbi:MAG: hypothetical protein JOZ41_04300 [Chloroflexi bacterium]|nr:hypothetical protein [Chloroflexota bacterium]
MDDILGFDQPEVEFLILADYVEAMHGKVYMMGGGWENIAVHDFEAPVTLQAAVGVQVPWNATNRPHTISVEIQTEDGETLATVDGNILAGRPPTMEHGASQRTIFAMKIPVLFPAPGTYVVASQINETPAKRVTFRALAAHPPAHAH